ncbi:SH3 domain-containing protein [Lysobacter sp. KIS68-7]|uniref:C40 family peptidase n=1 Tax=Lysobacter sp. KIS68-7 TaxID=2904252 RepID=UPI001E317D2A|nr:SH3 domain-containing protein [Lysobacter sp. KIS68-7]UHQ19336.1 SH3 domain-containing protein [Lysobacter sp. KIS68-7]
MQTKFMKSLLAMGLALAIATPAFALDKSSTAPSPSLLAVPGVTDAQLDPAFWIKRLGPEADRVLLDAKGVDAANARMLADDPTIHDLATLPASVTKAQASEWIADLSSRPTRTLYDDKGKEIPAATLDGLVADANLAAVPDAITPRYALVTERASLRTFPSNLRAFTDNDDTDIDRFQESALFPGMPVAIVHESRDGQWAFVVSKRYRAWIERKRIAEGPRDTVLAYAAATPYRLVTAPKVRTVYTPELPQASELPLDMGTRLPIADVPGDTPVNGQHPYTSYAVQLPLRNDDGTLRIAPALVQKNADTAASPLPVTQANILRQAFKFLGERYGWGHDYDARDCSGFVSEVYASLGLLMPRNTGDQARSPVLQRTPFTDTSTRAERDAAVSRLRVGDLVYIPGHVMMMIGTIDGQPYVIHDTNGGSFLGADGKLHSMHLNAVSVTPLLPLMYDPTHRYVDRMTTIVRVAH